VIRVSERRSGIDLLYCTGGWAVVFGDRLLGLFSSREEAIRGAREESHRVLAERGLSGEPPDPHKYPRLRSRRHVRHQRNYVEYLKE
jgi:hypothetical protein